MRTYDQLTSEEQTKAVDKALNILLGAICEGAIRFADDKNSDKLQEAIDGAFAEAEAMRTPWFAHEYIMDARYWPGDGHIVENDGLWPVAETLRGMASCDAEDAWYPDGGEQCIRL